MLRPFQTFISILSIIISRTSILLLVSWFLICSRLYLSKIFVNSSFPHLQVFSYHLLYSLKSQTDSKSSFLIHFSQIFLIWVFMCLSSKYLSNVCYCLSYFLPSQSLIINHSAQIFIIFNLLICYCSSNSTYIYLFYIFFHLKY